MDHKILLLIILAICGCSSTIETKSENKLTMDSTGPSISGFGDKGPEIKFISKGERPDVLEAADVLIYWDGESKFGTILFKHNKRWYASGGFMGSTATFLRDEAKVTGGLVVYISSTKTPYGKTKYGASISEMISLMAVPPNKFIFAHFPRAKFTVPPEYRDYYDKENKKIEYSDY